MMKITILNGSPDSQSDFEAHLEQVEHVLAGDGHTVHMFTLREMDIRSCVGCFGCWVKTPGECFSPDESSQVRRTVIDSDFLLWAAPLQMGFPNSLLKIMLDKSIPLIHPYFVVEHGEAHHRPRYDHYPRLGLLLGREEDTDEQDLEIVGDIFSRTALNMKNRLEFVHLSDQPIEETVKAITTYSSSGVAFETDLPPLAGVQISPPASLTLFNGSPRGLKGNTPLMLEQFAVGFKAGGGQCDEIHHLMRLKQKDAFVQAFAEAESVLLGFPLYTDAMPGIVKAFIEALEPLKGQTNNPPMGFLVQSGFPEPTHSRHIERYLKKFAGRMGSPYLGTIVRGNGEGTRLQPDSWNRRLYNPLQQLGLLYAKNGSFDTELLAKVARRERRPSYMMPFYKFFVRTPLSKMYWDMQLKKNGVYEERFARPYVD
jgi:multimeric flavodoxin WrbA